MAHLVEHDEKLLAEISLAVPLRVRAKVGVQDWRCTSGVQEQHKLEVMGF